MLFITIDNDIITVDDIIFLRTSCEYSYTKNINILVGMVSDYDIKLFKNIVPLMSWDERTSLIQGICPFITVVECSFICDINFIKQNSISVIGVRDNNFRVRFPSAVNIIHINLNNVEGIVTSSVLKNRILQQTFPLHKNIIFISAIFSNINIEYIKIIKQIRSLFYNSFIITGIYTDKTINELNLPPTLKSVVERIEICYELDIVNAVIKAPEICDEQFLKNNNIKVCVSHPDQKYYSSIKNTKYLFESSIFPILY
jgi:glycerol-3-phosphate cytidylyltransferase-like family protein